MSLSSSKLLEAVDEAIASIAIFPYHGMHYGPPKLTFRTNKREINENNYTCSGDRSVSDDERCMQPVHHGRPTKAD
jgi:hypothetical protein